MKRAKWGRPSLWVVCVLTLGSCVTPAPQPVKSAEAVSAPVDETAQLPLQGQIASRVVPNKLLGKSFLPGGTLADYKENGQSYQLFLARTASPQTAAFLLLDFKKELTEAKYLAHMGGYFGLDAGTPTYVFAKGPLIVGVIGLPQPDADAVARGFAARLR